MIKSKKEKVNFSKKLILAVKAIFYRLAFSCVVVAKILISIVIAICTVLHIIFWDYFSMYERIQIVIIALSCYTILFVVVPLIFIEVNQYIMVNRFTGCLNMKYGFSLIRMRNEKNKDSARDILCTGFLEALFSLPEVNSLKNVKLFKVRTHEEIYQEIVKRFHPIREIAPKKVFEKHVLIKVLALPIKKIFQKDSYYKYIYKKSKWYDFEFTLEDLKRIQQVGISHS